MLEVLANLGAFVAPARAQRVLDFDLENRPLSYLGQDFTTAEITALAASFGPTKKMHLWMLGQDDPRNMLQSFRELYDHADIVTGHYIRCMTPETRVLTADLRWVPGGELQVGDELLTFDEELSGPRRNMSFGTVVSNRLDCDEVYAVELVNGDILYATAEHPWLVSTRVAPGARHRWRRTDELLGTFSSHGRFAKVPALLSRTIAPWNDDPCRETGWLGGFYDGEGSIDGRSAGTKSQIAAYQNPGPVLETALRLLNERGFDYRVTLRSPSASALSTTNGYSIVLRGGYAEKLRFLGQVRPQRLLAKWRQMSPGHMRTRESVAIKSVTHVGSREVARLQTSTGTYFAEGYAVHNSHDLPIINGAMLEYNLPPLAPKLTWDTKLDLVDIKGVSKSQESIADMLGVPVSKVHMTQHDWRAANRLEHIELARARVTRDVRQHQHMLAKLQSLGMLRPPKLWSA